MKSILVAFVISVALSGQALATGSVSGKVIQVRVDASGRGMVVFDQVVNNGPACRTVDYANALAFDASTAGGKAILATALAAKAAGSAFTAYGAGVCSIYNGSYVEDWNYGVAS